MLPTYQEDKTAHVFLVSMMGLAGICVGTLMYPAVEHGWSTIFFSLSLVELMSMFIVLAYARLPAFLWPEDFMGSAERRGIQTYLGCF